jgi:hypothetical protein
MDARQALAGIRAGRPLEGARLRPARPHRPRLARPRRAPSERRAGPLPGAGPRAVRAWLLQQENAGRTFTAEQLAWLERIRDHVAASLGITSDDFAYTPFVEAGGLGKATQVFGDELAPLLDQLNEALAV